MRPKEAGGARAGRSVGPFGLVARIVAGWLVFVVALTLATMLGAAAESAFNDPHVRQAVQAAVVTGLVLPTIYALRRHGDGWSLRGLGLSSPMQGLPYFCLGVALVGAMAGVGMEAGSSVTIDYVVLLTGFGIVLQLCRIITGSLWTGIGFHLAWLEISRYIVAPRATPLVRIEDPVPGTAEVLVLFVGAILGSCLVLVLWSRLRKRPVGWRERDPAEAPVEASFPA